MADLVRSDTNGSSKARICSEIAYHEGYIKALIDHPNQEWRIDKLYIENMIEKLVENHADTMSYDSPDNHWWYADHMESLADDIMNLLNTFYGSHGTVGVRK